MEKLGVVYYRTSPQKFRSPGVFPATSIRIQWIPRKENIAHDIKPKVGITYLIQTTIRR